MVPHDYCHPQIDRKVNHHQIRDELFHRFGDDSTLFSDTETPLGARLSWEHHLSSHVFHRHRSPECWKKMASGVFTWAFYGYLWVYGGFLWVYGMMVTGLYRFRLVYLGSTLTLIARNMSRKKVTSPQDFSSWHPASNLWKNPARPRSANAFVCWKDGSVGLLGGAVELANE